MDIANYVIERREDKWCLLTRDKSRVLGCHDSEAGAQAQERAVEAAKHTEGAHSILGVQIFKTGRWNGDTYDEAALDEIVRAAQEVGFTPPVKLGHTDNTSAPAVGWLENIRRVGTALYADLVALPKQVYDLIRSRGYDAVSAEIYWNLERNGRKFPRVLKALALLGAEVPAVDLEPLRAFLALTPPPASVFRHYAVELATPDKARARPPAKKMASGGNESMDTKEHAEVMDPDADGNCEEGYVKGDDGKCHMKAKMSEHTQDKTPEKKPKRDERREDGVRDGEIIVKLSQLEELKQKAAKADGLVRLQQELESEKQKAAELADRKREDRIAYKTREIKIPAFRPFAKQFYSWALRDVPEAKIYSLGDPEKLMTPEEVVDEWVDAINRQADVLFRTLSVDTRRGGDPNEPDEVQQRIEYRVNAYLRANKLDSRKDYKAALQAVLNADPELKAEYSGT